MIMVKGDMITRTEGDILGAKLKIQRINFTTVSKCLYHRQYSLN